MKFGIGLPVIHLYPVVANSWEFTAPVDTVVRIARRADELGFDFLTFPEHIVVPSAMGEVMGTRYPEALTAMAFVAGATSRIKVLSYVMVLSYRNPIVCAKSIATLDFLSGGRVIVGIGAGHMQGEFEALGVPFEERGRMTDEYIQAMCELWTSECPAFEGRYVRFRDVLFEPRPVQKPRPPIWVGGNSRPAMRRAAALGDGWIPWLVRPHDMPACLEYIRSQPAFRERPRPFDVVVPIATFQVEDYSHRELGPTLAPRTRDELLEAIDRWREAGATGLIVGAPRTRSPEELEEWMAWFAADIMPIYRSSP